MTPNHTNFVDLDESYQSKVRIGNGDLVEVKGRGDVAVQTSTGTKLFSNVVHVPKISQSLLSVGQILEKNYVLHLQNKSFIILDSDGSQLMRVKMMGKSFPVEWEKPYFKAHTASIDESELW